MTALRLAFDVHAVGPQRPADAASVLLALKIASALAAEPDASEGEAALRALLPWNVCGPGTALRLIAPTGASGFDVTLAALAPDVDPFDGTLPAEIVRTAEALRAAGKLSLAWSRDPAQGAGVHVEAGDELTSGGTGALLEEEDTMPRPWLGLSSSIASLPAILSQPLRARWFAALEGDDLSFLRTLAAAGTVRELVLAPEKVLDARTGTEFTIETSEITVGGEDEGRRVTLVYRDPAGAEADILAYTIPLPAEFLIGGAVTGPNGDYWLAAFDSRADTLAEVDRIVMELGDPTRLASLLTDQLLGAFLVNRREERTALPAEVGAVARAARKWAEKLLEAPREAVAAEIYAATIADFRTGGGATIADEAARAVAKWWTGHLRDLPADEDLSDLELTSDGLAAALEESIRPLFKVGAEEGPVLPGEGLDFVVGEPDERLVSEAAAPAQDRSGINEISEYGLLVSRTSVEGGSAPWRIVTAGLPVMDPQRKLLAQPWGTQETLDLLPRVDVLTPRGIPLAFKDGLLRNDDTYFGQLMIGPSALSHLHRESENQQEQGDPLGDLSVVEFVAAGPVGNPDLAAGLAPPLRYGDHYGLRPFVIDRSGGLPAEIARDDRPWLIDSSKLAALPQAPSPIHFLRRVPVGDLNVQPWREVGGRKSWPALPAGVTLRAAEWWSARQAARDDIGNEPVPTVLLSGGEAGLLPASLEFTVEPPRIDEFTLQRWCMPATDEDPQAAKDQVDSFKAEYGRIAEARAALLQREDLTGGHGSNDAVRTAELLPHDPSIWGIAYRIRRFGPEGHELEPRPGDADIVPFRLGGPGEFIKKPVLFSWTSDAAPADLPPDAIRLERLEKGHFAALEFEMLVDEADGVRFDRTALGYETDADAAVEIDGEMRRFFRHAGATILVEAVTRRLPDPGALYHAFRLAPDEAGRVVARFQGAGVADLQFVDSFALERQRWVWRNLPLVPDGAGGDDDERRLCSGLPLDLADQNQDARDNSLAVHRFDARAELDTGFVMRALASGRWPRGSDGSVARDATLSIDDRDGQTAADYLRYGLTAVSRYAGVLGGHRVEAAPSGAEALPNASFEKIRGRWRRVVAAYRGRDQLRPLNILAVLPLTAHPRLDPLTGGEASVAPEAATPFLVILDEIWFREHGQGEALRAELVLEERELGEAEEGDTARRPLRYGPLPHKHLRPREFPGPLFTDGEAEKAAELRLTCFGPFGFSLDRSGNEALANATAFVVYIPDRWQVGPHWSVGVRFRRVLHGLDSGRGRLDEIRGPASGTYLLYTLPDGGRLAKIGKGGRAWFDRNDPERVVLAASNIGFETTPYVRAGNPAPGEVHNQYRYLLLAGPAGLDGGRGVELFLPAKAFWLREGQVVEDLRTGSGVVLPAGDRLRAQIVEVELSGSYPLPGAASGEEPPSEVDRAASLQDFFRSLLPPAKGKAHDRDAVGRVTRVSDVFDLERQPPGS